MEGTISNITGWGPNWSPRNWFPCEGRLLSIAQFTAFFSLIGTLYGGDGRTTFAVPDLRGRVPLGAGTGPGLTPRSNGQMSGIEWVTLNILEIPSHNHTLGGVAVSGSIDASINLGDATGSSDASNGQYLAQQTDITGTGAKGFTNAAFTPTAPKSTSPSQLGAGTVTGTFSGTTTGGSTGLNGSSQSHANMQPWQAIGWIICYQGIFPSRN